jgi:hypothetical protein
MTDADNGPLEPPSDVVTQYETLRCAALGEALPVEARSGLTLFLRRGLWEWARAMATTSAWPQPTRVPSSTWAAPEECRAAIHIFAAMAIHTNNGGARP